MQERVEKDRLDRLVSVRLRRASMPCGGIKDSMVLGSKGISLHLYFGMSVWQT